MRRQAGRTSRRSTLAREAIRRKARSSVTRDSSRHSLSPLSHSRPSPRTFQSVHRSSDFGESGCATIAKPPSRWTSSSTSRPSPASRYGACRQCPARRRGPSTVLISTGVDHEHAVRDSRGGSGTRVASPWSVRITNSRSARRAASAARRRRDPAPSERSGVHVHRAADDPSRSGAPERTACSGAVRRHQDATARSAAATR